MSVREKKRVIVGMSGGVDSSVTALLLHQQGHDVSGIFMKNWEDYPDRPCPAAQDAIDALNVCEQIGIPMDAVNFSREYWDKVFDYFLTEHQRGRTPNPDILCNKEIKFKVFLDYALAQGAACIATGHYARIEQQDGLYRLLKARDNHKDQTYFLYTLGQAQLAKSLFPLGDYVKPDVRKIAAQAGFLNSGKKDSMGICFIGEKNVKKFLGRYLASEPGPMCSVEGEQVGTHDGLMFYTIGQRHGLGIGGRRNSAGEPWYVIRKNRDNNTLVVAQGSHHPELFSSWLRASDLHWTSGTAPSLPFRCAAKTRYRQADAGCIIESIDQGKCTVVFDKPQWAVTAGQSVVFYADNECLGGGIIDKAQAN